MNALTSLHLTEILGFGNLLLVIVLVAASIGYLVFRQSSTKYPHILDLEGVSKSKSSNPA